MHIHPTHNYLFLSFFFFYYYYYYCHYFSFFNVCIIYFNHTRWWRRHHLPAKYVQTVQKINIEMNNTIIIIIKKNPLLCMIILHVFTFIPFLNHFLFIVFDDLFLHLSKSNNHTFCLFIVSFIFL